MPVAVLPLARKLLAVATLFAAACSSSGAYSITWQIAAVGAAAPVPATAYNCASHGIFTVVVTLQQGGQTVVTDTFGCSDVPATSGVGPGTYDFILTGGDALGNPVTEPVMIKGVNVANAATVEIQPAEATLKASAQCADRVDNDGDGFIDLADPGCGGDPNGNDEAAM